MMPYQEPPRLPPYSEFAYTEYSRLHPVVDTEQDGSEERFKQRLSIFKEKKMSIAMHNAWWFVHNAIAHPLIGIAPNKHTFAFHDWTSRKINGA